jgi:hypothetical protein
MAVQAAASGGGAHPKGLTRGNFSGVGKAGGVGEGKAPAKSDVAGLDLGRLAIEDGKLLSAEEQAAQKKTNRETLNLALLNGGGSVDFLLTRAEAYGEGEDVGQAFDGLVLDELRELHCPISGDDADPVDDGSEPTPGTEPKKPCSATDPTGGVTAPAVKDPDGYLFGKDGKPSADEVAQFAVGDCYLFAAAMGLAETNPDFITNELIKANDDGSYTVTLFETKGDTAELVLDEQGKPKKVEINVTKDEVDQLANFGGARSGGAASGGAHWAQVLEVAYAKYWSPRDLGRGLQAIEGGFTQNAFANLTGKSSQVIPLNETGAEALDKLLKTPAEPPVPLMLHAFRESGDIDPTTGVYTDGADKDKQDGLVDGHAYQVVSIKPDGNGDFLVTLRNPWGQDVPSGPDGKPMVMDGFTPDGNPEDGLVVVKLSDLMKNGKNELVVGALPDTAVATGPGGDGAGDDTSASLERPKSSPGTWRGLSSSETFGFPARLHELFRNYEMA